MEDEELNQLIFATPPNWHEFVRLLKSSSFQRLNIWYVNQKSSSHNVYPELQTLLTALLSEDAFLRSDKTLIFEARILRFKAKAQTFFVKLLVKYKEDLEIVDIGKIVDFYEGFLTKRNAKKVQTTDERDGRYKDQNEEFQELADHLTDLDEYVQECVFKETVCDYDWVGSQEELLEASGLSQSTRKRIATQRSMVSPSSKRSAQHDVSFMPCSQYFTQEVHSSFEHDELSSQIRECFERLKTSWINNESMANTDDIRVFSTVNPEQLPEVRDILDSEGLDLETTCLVLKDVTCLVDEMSYSVIRQLLTLLLLPKIQSLEQNAPWLVVQGLVEFTKEFQTAVIESLCLPCLTAPSSGAAIGDLMAKICKEALNAENKTFLFKLVAESGCEMSDVTIAVLHMLCDNKIAVDEGVMRSLLQCLEANSIKHSDNVKFGKLLLVIVNRYGKQMEPQYLQQIQFITETQKYFFKKSILTAIKRIKTG